MSMSLGDSRRLSQLLAKRIEQYGYKNALKHEDKGSELAQSFYGSSSRCSSRNRSCSVAEINEKLKKKYKATLERARSQENSDMIYLSQVLGSNRQVKHAVEYENHNGIINGQFLG